MENPILKKTVLMLICCLLAVSVQAQRKKDRKKRGQAIETAVVAPPKFTLANYTDSVSYAIGMNIGSSVNAQKMDSLNLDALVQGLRGAVGGQDTLLMGEQATMMFLQTYFQKARMAMVEKNKKAADAFFAENKAKPGVVTTGTGLQYLVLKEGTGAYPKPTDKVKVHYTGTLLDGTKFDSSLDRGEPAVFGVTQVIKGWTEALQMMKSGSKWRVFIPTELAYGEQGQRSIPPNSILIFEMELLGIEK